MNKYYLTVDLGNTDLVIGVYCNKDLIITHRVPLVEVSSDFYAWINEKVKEYNISRVGISCVVPRCKEDLIGACLKISDDVISVDSSTFTDFVIKADNPAEVGADLLVAAYGSIHKYDCPIVIFDFGSATKTIFINSKKELVGVNIKPGIYQSLQTMVEKIPHLPEVELKVPNKLLGTNTIDAIQAGIFQGEISMVEGFVNKLQKSVDQKLCLVITGGFSAIFHHEIEGCHYEPNIILDGLIEILHKYY